MSAADSLSASPEVPFFNIFDPEFDFNSAEMNAAQARGWYAASPVGLLVLRYAEAQELLRDRRLDHNGKRFMEQTCGVFSGPAYDWYVPMISNRDGEDHSRLRRLMSKTFTPRMIDDLRPFIRAQAGRLADQIASAGECEFVEDFATQLPLAVMCHMLGVPPEDYDTFRVWGTDIGLVFGMARGGDIPGRVEDAVTGLSGYADSLIEQISPLRSASERRRRGGSAFMRRHPWQRLSARNTKYQYLSRLVRATRPASLAAAASAARSCLNSPTRTSRSA